jgi:hypothetical protein
MVRGLDRTLSIDGSGAGAAIRCIPVSDTIGRRVPSLASKPAGRRRQSCVGVGGGGRRCADCCLQSARFSRRRVAISVNCRTDARCMHQRLKEFARARGVSLNKLVEEWATVALAQLEAENRYRLRGARGLPRQAWRCSTSLIVPAATVTGEEEVYRLPPQLSTTQVSPQGSVSISREDGRMFTINLAQVLRTSATSPISDVEGLPGGRSTTTCVVADLDNARFDAGLLITFLDQLRKQVPWQQDPRRAA